MIINCNEEGMVLIAGDININITKENAKQIKEEYEYYFGDEECNELQSDCVDDITINKTILSIVNKYVNKHPIGKTIGAEYVAQDDEAQEDAQEMFEKIMEYYASLEE